MGKRLYDKQYHLAPYRGSVGTMRCCTCGQQIDPEEDDFREAKATDRLEGWGYRTHHRKCLADDSGFIEAERRVEARKARAQAMLKAAVDFKSLWGVHDLDQLIDELEREASHD